MRTSEAARASGYSVQQVRDLERLGVLPPSLRGANGYRDYTERHVRALSAYRGVALAAGPVAARRLLSRLSTGTVAEAAAAVDDLHAALAAERRETERALDALQVIAAEGWAGGEESAMTITELAAALGVRSSTLRYWEDAGLVEPQRVTSLRARRYDEAAIRAARIVTALRGAGYPVPVVRELVTALRDHRDTADADAVLRARLDAIAARSVALLRAGADLAAVIEARP